MYKTKEIYYNWQKKKITWDAVESRSGNDLVVGSQEENKNHMLKTEKKRIPSIKFMWDTVETRNCNDRAVGGRGVGWRG